MLLTYQRTIQQAFRGVSDSLVEYQKDREFRERQQEARASRPGCSATFGNALQGRRYQLPGGAHK